MVILLNQMELGLFNRENILAKELIYPENPQKLLQFLEEYDFVVPIIYQEQIGYRVVVSIYAHDFLALLKMANVAPLMFCPHCGSGNDYKKGTFVACGSTKKGRKQWKCKECGHKTSTLKV